MSDRKTYLTALGVLALCTLAAVWLGRRHARDTTDQYAAKGLAAMEAKDFREAGVMYGTAADRESDPKRCAELRYQQALAKLSDGNPRGARAAVESAIALDPRPEYFSLRDQIDGK